jgi:CheY-like chemotaxis protein
MTAKRILSVGQCQADHGRLAQTIRHLFGAEVVGVDDAVEADRRLGEQAFDLILVNRIFDANGASGIDFIRGLKRRNLAWAPVMLVSNHEDAQREAIAAGAVPGFGKASLGHAAMVERLRPLLGNDNVQNQL